MPNWSASMQQTFEYYQVDPGTWKDIKRITTVTACDISRDAEAETLGSASITVTESLGECYIRVYLVTTQDDITEKHPLGTFLVQTPGLNFDGKVQSLSADAYTPLLELKESPPPIGYSILEGENIMDRVYGLVREHARAPAVKATDDTVLHYDFVADPNDTWLSFLTDLMTNAKFIFTLDEMGRILFSPKQSTASLQPVWTYSDDNDSILYQDISVSKDLYRIPNVVEVLYSKGSDTYYSRVVNDDPGSPVSTVNRGREIIHRVTDPDTIGDPTREQINDYAKNLLEELSVIECTVTYTHGYCPVRVGDCVRINYSRAGLTGVKAKVISQNIRCESGCPVSETAVFITRLWGNGI